MNWLPLPILGAGVILVTALVLIFVVTLRPWEGADESANTLLNYSEVAPDGYDRSPLSFVGSDFDAVLNWHPSPDIDKADAEYDQARFVSYRCASCHGLTGQGGAVGENLEEATPSEMRKALKKGSEGMPEYTGLTTEEVNSLIKFITGKQPAAVIDPTEEPKSDPPAGTPPAPTLTAASPAATIPSPAATIAPPATRAPSESGTPAATVVPTPTPPEPGEPEPSPTAQPLSKEVAFEAVQAGIVVDGDVSDWDGIPANPVTLEEIKPIPGEDMGQVEPVDVALRVALDDERVYVLMEVPNDYDYVADDRGLSASIAVMFRIDPPAEPHMGTTEEKQKKSLGMVDIWHWELDCGPGELSGGNATASGNDPDCNFDDEYSTTPEKREDDETTKAENSLAGVWDHTARAQGKGASGAWIFEMSRLLETGDPQDAQLQAGGTAHMALAYFDPDETPDGWTSVGHLQSATGGWIVVTLP
jgi:mono/diheme cytochrome c family protein